MWYSKKELEKLYAQDLFGKPELEKYLNRVLNMSGLGETVDVHVPGPLSEEVCYELNRCMEAPDLPNPKVFWKP